jgi:hypothetical protein
MSEPKHDIITSELNKDMFHNIFSYLIESDSKKALSTGNKSQYSTLLSVSSRWNQIMKDDIVWEPIALAVWGKDYPSKSFFPLIKNVGLNICVASSLCENKIRSYLIDNLSWI